MDVVAGDDHLAAAHNIQRILRTRHHRHHTGDAHRLEEGQCLNPFRALLVAEGADHQKDLGRLDDVSGVAQDLEHAVAVQRLVAFGEDLDVVSRPAQSLPVVGAGVDAAVVHPR